LPDTAAPTGLRRALIKHVAPYQAA
jgi:hypothetical protein